MEYTRRDGFCRPVFCLLKTIFILTVYRLPFVVV